ncbi:MULTISPECIES: hypothetical protein [unclassified Nocardioides]|uniref:hypothetical protein n=1 Tax=unclassified Nocardioides TaxID=2615069 RepID=UPI0036236399
MQVGGFYVDYRGRRHRDLFRSAVWVGVPAAAGRDDEQFPDALEYGESGGVSWVKLPVEALERRVKVTVEATWRDEPVTVVGPVIDGTVLLNYDRSPARARELGMEGDQHMGWQIRVPAGEVDVTGVTEREY